jgi:hypothetical protein
MFLEGLDCLRPSIDEERPIKLSSSILANLSKLDCTLSCGRGQQMLADVYVIDPILLLFLNPIDLVNLLVAKIKLESKELKSI